MPPPANLTGYRPRIFTAVFLAPNQVSVDTFFGPIAGYPFCEAIRITCKDIYPTRFPFVAYWQTRPVADFFATGNTRPMWEPMFTPSSPIPGQALTTIYPRVFSPIRNPWIRFGTLGQNTNPFPMMVILSIYSDDLSSSPGRPYAMAKRNTH